LRTSLLAAASLIAVAFSIPAQAEDCGCRDRVRAALTRQAPTAAARPVQTGASAAAGYNYAAARPVNMAAYRQRWEAPPQGYVPPPQGYAESTAEAYGEGYGYAAPMPYGGSAMASNPAYPDGWAYNYQPPGIEIDQQGWFGGVGYGAGADGGGGGGGGMTLTLAQPDAANGYGPGSGGSYGATNRVNAWRAEAFAPKASK
jgi:hypothetical protein